MIPQKHSVFFTFYLTYSTITLFIFPLFLYKKYNFPHFSFFNDFSHLSSHVFSPLDSFP